MLRRDCLKTPHIDQLAAEGQRFTSGYCSGSTCTPTRVSFLSGTYAFRREGTGIAPINGPLTIPPETPTLPDLAKQAGYRTAVIGKWHFGLGGPGGPDWNGEIKPGPLEIGFDHANDPGEKTNVIGKQPERTEEMKERLAGYIESGCSRPPGK